MPRITVLHIRDSGGMFGGERVILTLGKNIDRGKYDFKLLCLDRGDGRSWPLINSARELGISVLTVPVQKGFDRAGIRRMRQIINANNAMILHTHDFKTDFYGLAASMGTAVKLVATAHGSTRDSLAKRIYLAIDERLIYRWFDRVIVVSEELKQQLRGKGVPDRKIAFIRNGLDKELIGQGQGGQSEEPLPIMPGAKVFAVVGRLFPDKGHRYFLEAFSRVQAIHPDIQGLIVGDGPGSEEIKEQIRSLGLDEIVQLCGVRRNMEKVYQSIDYLVLPSLREGLPYCLLEAMAKGVPVLATAVGDVPKLVHRGETGNLVPPGDPDALTKAMLDMISGQESVRLMADKGRALINDEFSAAEMVRQTQQVYSALANRA